ncbi:hypothetical protein B0H14DRAFT_2632447 [Mycena olivaceomarginata]|nr:hypothetical protein B0H14DRAFT_2644542 [Mycena olivaceomarginata]KAJ7771232.1 hypothetical protein B0H14DRAFT_2632447 [Mycena olivaceomarginata]
MGLHTLAITAITKFVARHYQADRRISATYFPTNTTKLVNVQSFWVSTVHLRWGGGGGSYGSVGDLASTLGDALGSKRSEALGQVAAVTADLLADATVPKTALR